MNCMFRLNKNYQKRVETQDCEKPKKKVQFRNVATEPDLLEMNDKSMGDENDSNEISRQDTMVEHSIVVNEEVKNEDDADYLKALQSAKFDQIVMNLDSNRRSGECEIEQRIDGQIFNKVAEFSREEEKIIEKTLLQIRDRIRSGLPLSHQINQQ